MKSLHLRELKMDLKKIAEEYSAEIRNEFIKDDCYDQDQLEEQYMKSGIAHYWLQRGIRVTSDFYLSLLKPKPKTELPEPYRSVLIVHSGNLSIGYVTADKVWDDLEYCNDNFVWIDITKLLELNKKP